MLDFASRPEPAADLQRRIISAMQDGLPIVPEPYQQVANQLGITEAELLTALESMHARSTIRRVGVVPNHYALGYCHNLMVVWDIDNNDVDDAGFRIGELEFVSHCYRRPRLPGWPYNLFVMVHGKTEAEVQEKIQWVRQCIGSGYRSHTSLRSTKILKKTGLRIRSGG